MIEVKDLYKYYQMGRDVLSALDGVSLNIAKGEFVAIVGHSGSGKSTLMHIIGGLDRPSKGSIIVDGKDISKFKDNEMSKYRNQKIGFVFQSFNLEPTRTALENVMMPLMFAGIPEKKRREMAMEALKTVELGDRANHKPTELSGGQRQRVSIARALVNKPDIIIADEPTGNLDSKSGTVVMNMLRNLTNNGYTVIMVTHNMEDAAVADKIIRIKDGRIVEEEKV